MAFILTGDPAEHGGSGVPAPVLVYADGLFFVHVHPGVEDPIEFDNQGQAIVAADAMPFRSAVVELRSESREAASIIEEVMREEGRIIRPGSPPGLENQAAAFRMAR